MVGGKNASLGELLRALEALGIAVPSGFAVTASGYRAFLAEAKLVEPITRIVSSLRKENVEELIRGSDRIKDLMLHAPLPKALSHELETAYRELSKEHGEEATDVAVRSSATAEDLPTASFAGQQESLLNVRGAASVVDAVKKAFASLFTPRAISYRIDMGFDHMKVALSVGVQKMVRSDRASAGVIFTLPSGFASLFWKKLGTKEVRLIYDEHGQRQMKSVPTSPEERAQLSLTDADAFTLARWAIAIEDHYSKVHGAPTPDGHRVGERRAHGGALHRAGATRDGAQPAHTADREPLRDRVVGGGDRHGPRRRRRDRRGKRACRARRGLDRRAPSW